MNETTIKELREAWQHVSEGEGGHCPVCQRWGKVYTITLTGSMVRALGWLYKHQMHTGEPWVNVPQHAPTYVMRSYSLSSLKHWGLIYHMPMDPNSKHKTKTSGCWSISPMGKNFILNYTEIPKQVYVYDDAVRGYSKETVTAKQVMDKKFDYDVMMADMFASAALQNK